MENRSPRVLFERITNLADARAARCYVSYFWQNWRSGRLYERWHRVKTIFAPALWLSRIVRITVRVFYWIETSALLLSIALIFLICLPILLLGTLLYVGMAAANSRYADRRWVSFLRGRRILVLFAEGESDFFRRSIPSLSAYAVLLVGDLPHKRETGRRLPPAAAAFLRSDGVLCVRPWYYFHLRRILTRQSDFFAVIF